MELPSRSCVDHRPRIRLHRTTSLPRHHRDARAAPSHLGHPVLPRRRGDRRDQAGHGPTLPGRHARWLVGLPAQPLDQLASVPVGRAARIGARRGQRCPLLPKPQRHRAGASEAGADGDRGSHGRRRGNRQVRRGTCLTRTIQPGLLSGRYSRIFERIRHRTSLLATATTWERERERDRVSESGEG